MVGRELYEAYSRALGTLSDAAEAELARALANVDSLESAGDYARATAAYDAVVRRFGRVASEVAREFYQEQRDASDLDTDYVALRAPEIPGSYTARDVVEARHKGVTAQEALGWLGGKGSRRVMENADYTIGYNASRDPAHPKWAVVPHPGACGFCVIVASNGWSMAKKPVNAQRHSHCKCTVVADFDVANPALEGYDPEALRELYGRAEANVGERAREAWESMSADERKAYARKGRSAFDVFKTKMVSDEIDRLDGNAARREWRKAVASVSEKRIKQSQLKHFKGTAQYERAETPPSYFVVKEGASTREMLSYAADVIARTAGTGVCGICEGTGEWDRKEAVVLPEDVIAIDGKTGKPVRGGKIHYGNVAVHIVPKYSGGAK